jgi:hypothetical protein
MINIAEEVDNARYSDILEEVVNNLNPVELLRKNYESDYQGFVDIDVLLENGRVFSYNYSYGSCSGCDEWEDRSYSDAEIAEEMREHAVLFENIDEYNLWREKVIEENIR